MTSPRRPLAGAGLAALLAHAARLWYARIMLLRIGILALAASASQGGCEKIFGDGSQNAHAPGTDLGSFHVSANATSNSCGQGALGSQASWQFDVRLQRDAEQGVLFWNNGQVSISGALSADDKSFGFDTQVIQNMRDPDVVGPPPCSLVRSDHATGTLDSAADPVKSFTGTLSYTFTPSAGSNCEDLVVSDAPIVAVLPCAMEYTMSASSATLDE